MGPPVYSDIAQKYQFDISLLERLFEYKAYNTGVGATCKTLLTENYRSHPTVSVYMYIHTFWQCQLPVLALNNAPVQYKLRNLDNFLV